MVKMADYTFHWADYLIFIGFICVSLSMGFFHACTGGKQKTLSEFLVADRKVKVVPTAISMVVSYLSAITILGQVAETYNFGCAFFIWGMIPHVLAPLLAERIVVPWIYCNQLVSVFQVSNKNLQKGLHTLVHEGSYSFHFQNKYPSKREFGTNKYK